MPRNEVAVWDRFAGIYDRFMKGDKMLYRQIADRIIPRLHHGDRVLEIATGTGIIALELAGCGIPVEAVDFSRAMIAMAREKAEKLGVTGVTFSVQDAYGLTYPPGSFDSVIIANTLHIMPSPERALTEIRRVMKPGGILIAPTFVHAGGTRAAIFSRLMSITGCRVYYRWDQAGYHHFLEENGFAVVDFAVLGARFPLAYAVAKPQGIVV